MLTHYKGFFFYLVFGLGSLLLSGLSFGLWMFNPLPFAFSYLATPLVFLLGRSPTYGTFGLGTILWTGLLWPLTLVPLYWLTFRWLQWNRWAYLALLLFSGVLIALIVQLADSYPDPAPGVGEPLTMQRVLLKDSPISLKVGESHEFVADRLRLTFLRVIEETCMKGEICDKQKPPAIEMVVQLEDGEPSKLVFETPLSVAEVRGVKESRFFYISLQALTPLSPVGYTATFDVYTEIAESH